MAFDPHANLAYAIVTTAPSPADSGLTLEIVNADAAQFPDPAVDGEYNCTDWAAQEIPIRSNSEIIRITAKAAAPAQAVAAPPVTVPVAPTSVSVEGEKKGD